MSKSSITVGATPGLDDRLTLLLDAANGAGRGLELEIYNEAKLSLPQYRILRYVAQAQRAGHQLNPSDLAALLLQATHSVSWLLNRLEDSDPRLIDRTRDRTDRRLVWVTLTPAGAQLERRLTAVYESFLDRWLGQIDRARQSTTFVTAGDPDLETLSRVGFSIGKFDLERRAEALERLGATS